MDSSATRPQLYESHSPSDGFPVRWTLLTRLPELAWFRPKTLPNLLSVSTGYQHADFTILVTKRQAVNYHCGNFLRVVFSEMEVRETDITDENKDADTRAMRRAGYR
ncbi:MAG TPA: hypothetical protein VGV59_08775 [Pyrinomonadaceae bacterium]|nr:hypothetical protein [Pyrinomonadaceae bacterium]